MALYEDLAQIVAMVFFVLNHLFVVPLPIELKRRVDRDWGTWGTLVGRLPWDLAF